MATDPYAQYDLEDPSAPAATPSSGADPYSQYDLEDPSAQPAAAQTPDGSSRSQAAADSVTGGDTSPDGLQEVTVTAKRPPPAPPSNWLDTLSDVPGAIAAKFKSRVAGAQEYLGTDEAKDAQTKLWQSLVLPQAVKEAKDAGIALTDVPYVQDTAKRLGVRVDQFTKDWPDYEGMTPQQQNDFYHQQVNRLQAGQQQAQTGQTGRESAQAQSEANTPNAPGFSPKNIVFQTLTGIPDLLAGMTVGAGATAVGGPAVGAAATTAYFVGTAAPEEYAEARNQGADHDTAATYAALSALSNAVPEIPVLKAVTDGGYGRQLIARATSDAFADSLGGRVANTAASQALAQTVVSAAQQGIDTGVLDKDVSLKDALAQMAQSALVGGLSGAPLGVVHTGHGAQQQEGSAQRHEPTIGDELPAGSKAQPIDSSVPQPVATADSKTPDPAKTKAALEAVMDKSVDPSQIDHLEGLGLATRNDVGVPRLLPAGRRELLRLSQPGAEEASGNTEKDAKPTQEPVQPVESANPSDEKDEPQITQFPAHQRTTEAHGYKPGDMVRIPDEGNEHSQTNGGEQAIIRSIFRHSDDEPWMARVQTESGASMAIDLNGPDSLERTTGMPEEKEREAETQPETTEQIGGLAPRPETLPLTERLKTDDQLRDTLTQMKGETGWLQEGGKVLMDEDHNVIGRTGWIPHQEWWASRPGGQGESKSALTEDQVHAAVDKALAGDKLGTKQQATVEHMVTEADSRNLPAGQEDFDQALQKARSETNTSPTEEQKASGDYAKGGLDYAGMPVKIESPAGSTRSGADSTGRQWTRTMGRDYGYIDGTKSKDGEGVDVFLAGRPDTGHVYVINQKNPDGSFDETKSVLGAMSKEEAKSIYLSHYPKGWKGFGSIVDMPTQEFKKWAHSKAPLREAVERHPPRTSDMNEFQLRAALRSHELTGLPNRRAYNEDEKLPYQASLDVDSLKWINDNMGHEAGDNLLKHVAEVLREHVDNVYHISGDEFVAQGEDEAKLHEQLQAAVADLKTSRIHQEMDDGRVARMEGLGLSYGVGRDLHEAEQHLQAAKSSREAQGLRAARGEKPGGASFEDAEERQAREDHLYAWEPPETELNVGEHQTDFFRTAKVPESPEPDLRRTQAAQVVAPKRPDSQLQIFTSVDAPTARPARTASRTQLAEVGRFHSGIKQVKKWQDAAHIFAPLRKSPQESMMALALDAAGKPLAVVRHSIGGPSEASAIPHLIIGAVAKIPHVAGVYFGHNHPSGQVEQSGADMNITNRLHELMRGSGIDPLGMIVVSPGNTKASFYHPYMGGEGSVEGPIRPAPRKKSASVPVVERRFKRIPTASQKGQATSPESAKNYVEAAAKQGGPSGMLVLDGRHQVIGHMPMTASEMATLRTGSKTSGTAHIMREMEDMNASAVITYGEDKDSLRNLGSMLSQSGVKLLDSFQKKGAEYVSHSEQGLNPLQRDDGAFYSRNNGSGMQREDLERTVRKTIRDAGMQSAPDFPHVEVHQDFTTLPPRLREHVQDNGAEHTAGAVFDPRTGRIHMIADNLGSEKEAQETLWHEAVGHHGLRLIMDGDRYRQTMDGIWNAMPDRVKATAQRNGLDVNDLQQRRMAAEEVVAYAAGAHLAGTEIPQEVKPIWQRALSAVKQFFAKVTGKPFTTDQDIAKIIAESKNALQSGAAQQRDGAIAESTRAPVFHSAVERAVEASKQAKASADQWLATLRKTPGVKAEEMQWLGVEDWLKEHKGPVAKSDLQDFIKANQLHLEETVHGTSDEEQTDLQRKQTDLAEQLRAKGYQVTFDDLGELARVTPPDITEHVQSTPRYTYDDDAFNAFPDEHQQIAEELRDVSKAVAHEALGRMGDAPRGWDRIDPQTTRYEDYTLPGGKNYREMLLRKPVDAGDVKPAGNQRDLPNGKWLVTQSGLQDKLFDSQIEARNYQIQQAMKYDESIGYKSGHWPERNILAHVRFKDRTDAEGKKILFLEELQSDWHQAGRKGGYRDPDAQAKELALQNLRRDLENIGRDATPEQKQEWADVMNKLQELQKPKVPDAPFKTTWPSLIMKRMIRHAAEGGYDRIAWTTGVQQAERYDLSHQIESLSAFGFTDPDGTKKYFLAAKHPEGGNVPGLEKAITESELEGMVGKDLAAKIAAQPLDENRKYSGLDLQVGGEGMRGFYDDILPRETQKLIGKFGGKVGETDIETTPHIKPMGTMVPKEIPAGHATVHSFDVTQPMRDAALSQGFPMYWKKPSQQQLALQGPKGPKWYERVRNAVDHIVHNPLTNDFRKMVSPTQMDEDSRRTARLATAALGNLAHNTFETQHALEAFSRQIDRLKPEEQLEMMDAIEHGLPQPNAELQPIANEMRKQLDVNRDKVRALGIGALDNFIENYFPHYWADPDEAKRMMATIMGRRPLRGPASFLKMRTIPTIKEGMDAGLQPLTINPLVLTLLKVREMQRFVSGVKMMEGLKDAHLAQFLPSTKSMPHGWVGINDNSAKVRQWSEEEHGFIERGQYIMPENAGRLINNHVGRSAIADFMPLHALRIGSNVLNSLQLGFSAFHLGFTTLDAMVSKNALAIERLTHGEPGRAAAALIEGTTPIGAAMNLKRGMTLMRAYANPSGATPEMAKVVQALTQGGGRVSMDRYYMAIQGASPFHGVGLVSLAGDIKSAIKGQEPVKDVAGAIARFPVEYGRSIYRGLQDMVRTTPTLQIPFEMAGRVARAGSSLIMEHIVPLQKLGVFSDMAQDYLRRNPAATDDQLATAMQSAWSSVDNRLGEMVYDNLFWNRTLKDSFHLGVRAVGWNLGTVREIGGAVPDLIKLIDKGITTGKITGDDVGHKIPYVLAMTLTTALLGSTITYAFTGKGPQELKDYFFPPTGGTTTHGTPERVSLPSYVKDIYEYSQRPGQTITNKLNPIFGLLSSIWNNQDFFGDPISDPTASGVKQLGERAAYVGREMTPFSIQGQKQISGAESQDFSGQAKRVLPFVGITPAPGYITSPDQIERRQKYEDEERYSKELRYKLNQAAQKGDQGAIKDLKDQYIQSRERLRQLEEGVKMDKAKSAKARNKTAMTLRSQGKPATAGLIQSLPLEPDQEALSYFTRIAGVA